MSARSALLRAGLLTLLFTLLISAESSSLPLSDIAEPPTPSCHYDVAIVPCAVCPANKDAFCGGGTRFSSCFPAPYGNSCAGNEENAGYGLCLGYMAARCQKKLRKSFGSR